MEQVIAQSPAQIEDNLYAREVSGGVFDRAVGRVVVRYVELRQLYLRIHYKRIRCVPEEYQILRRVRNWRGNKEFKKYEERERERKSRIAMMD